MTVKEKQKARSKAKQRHKHLLVSVIEYLRELHPGITANQIAEQMEFRGLAKMGGSLNWNRSAVLTLSSSDAMRKADPAFARSFFALYPDSSGFLPVF